MSVTRVEKDPAARTITLVAEFAAPPDRAWDLWADPRRLERWWGPPEYPATVHTHDLRPGGEVTFVVAGHGERHEGWWRVREVDPPRGLAFDLGDDDHPTMDARVRLDDRDGGGTRMTITITFPDDAGMDLFVGLGFTEGLTAAAGQIDAALGEA